MERKGKEGNRNRYEKMEVKGERGRRENVQETQEEGGRSMNRIKKTSAVGGIGGRGKQKRGREKNDTKKNKEIYDD